MVILITFCVLPLAPASSSDSSSSLEQEKYLQAILNSIPIYFKMNGNNTLSNRSLIGLSPGTLQHRSSCPDFIFVYLLMLQDIVVSNIKFMCYIVVTFESLELSKQQ